MGEKEGLSDQPSRRKIQMPEMSEDPLMGIETFPWGQRPGAIQSANMPTDTSQLKMQTWCPVNQGAC
jgi:hypothetical protein